MTNTVLAVNAATPKASLMPQAKSTAKTFNPIMSPAAAADAAVSLKARKATEAPPILKVKSSAATQQALDGAAAVKPGPVTVISHNWTTGKDDVARKTGQGPVADKDVNDAFKNFTDVQKYYADSFGRSGWDGKGATAKVVVHPVGFSGEKNFDNAYWSATDKTFYMGDGDGKNHKPLGGAPDVAAHEYTHAVIDSEVRLNGTGKQGGLHESFSDVLGSGLDRNWKIGESVTTGADGTDSFRDMTKPTYNNEKTLPPGLDEEHDLSGPPSLAAVKVAQAIGDDKMRQIWYKGLTENLKPHSEYSGAMRATLQSTAALYGKDSKEFQAVNDAWRAVGVEPSWNHSRKRQLEKINDAFLAAQKVQK